MTPHELLKCMPASNCGKCGHPSCLAFAVAVTRGGVAPDGCPYLDWTRLPAGFVGTGGRNVLEEEHDKTFAERLRAKMLGLDFSSLAARLGGDWSPDRPQKLRFLYLGQAAELSSEMIAMDGAEPSDPRDQILLCNYVASGGGRMPNGTWIGMESLPNSISKVHALSTYCEQRLADRFRGRIDRLAALGAALGATSDNGGNAALGLVVPVLPCVPLWLLFWDQEPEDNFDAKVKILFDSHVLDFLDLESLVFAAERMADRLLELDCR